jgi:predicted membrane channel-forming protein YqfA (hemolysin III family)
MSAGISGLMCRIRSWMRETLTTANRRLLIAMTCYFVLLGVALYILLPARTKDDQFLLFMVLAVFTILIFKTLAHADDE